VPYYEAMNWDQSKKRWHRYHKGTMYRLPASKLGPTPTREATRAAANHWWAKKEAELNGYTTDLAEQLGGRKELIVTQEDADRLIPKYVNPDRSVKAQGQAFLEIVKGEVRPMSYREIKWCIEHIPNQDADVAIYDEPYVEKSYLDLRSRNLSESRKKKRWDILRRFLRYLWSRRLIELPRNLDSYGFTVRPQKIPTYPLPQVRKALARLQPRQRLYGLLALNCGCNNVDIGQLRKDQVDREAGTLTRRRVKTGDNPQVPTVTYSLWPETLALLKNHWSAHPELALTSKDNTPLWTASVEGDRTPRKDLILKQWQKAKPGIPLKALRSISATLLESHETYGRYVPHFLGHSPKTIAARHYAAPSQGLFDEALRWLHDQLLT
jgi:integrase